jgi:hypothetical protein
MKGTQIPFRRVDVAHASATNGADDRMTHNRSTSERTDARSKGIDPEQAQKMTGDELVSAIGPAATYELVLALDGEGKTIAYKKGQPGRRSANDGLRRRNILILRMRLLEGRGLSEIGRLAEISGTRVRHILREYFGVKKEIVPRGSVIIPSDASLVARDAVRQQLVSIVGELAQSVDEIAVILRRFDVARSLLNELEAGAELYLTRERGSLLVKALRAQMDSERSIANRPTVERLLSAILP